MDSGGKWQGCVKATADMRVAQQILRVLFLLVLTDLFKMMRVKKKKKEKEEEAFLHILPDLVSEQGE